MVIKPGTAPTTPNQLVAWNLAYFRKAAGWTQEEFAARLWHAGYGDAPMSKAALSAAERSSDGNRVRQFDADFIVGMSLALGVPIHAFFLPPTGMPESDSFADTDSPAMAAYQARTALDSEATVPRNQPTHKPMMSEDNAVARIEFEMTRRGWSQGRVTREMAKVGHPIHQSAVSNIMSPKPGAKRRHVSVDEAIGIAKVFAIPVESLMLPLEAALDVVAYAALVEIAELTSVREASDNRIAELQTQVDRITRLGQST